MGLPLRVSTTDVGLEPSRLAKESITSASIASYAQWQKKEPSRHRLECYPNKELFRVVQMKSMFQSASPVLLSSEETKVLAYYKDLSEDYRAAAVAYLQRLRAEMKTYREMVDNAMSISGQSLADDDANL